MRHRLALYLASVIVGVGVLELPIAAARSGLVPLMAAIVLVARLTYAIYNRIVSLADIYGRTQYSLQKAAEASGLGLSARIGFTFGMFAYALSADVAYVLIASASIASLRGLVPRVRIGAALVLISLALRRDVALFKTTLLVGLRCVLIGLSPSRHAAALGYLATLFLVEAYPERGREALGETEEFLPRHAVAAIYTFAKISVLLAAAAISAAIIASKSGLALDVPPRPERRRDAYYAFGISIFAFVGLGVCNALIYPRYSGKFAKRVNLEAVSVVAIIYAAFVLLTVSAVPLDILRYEDVSCGHAFLAFATALSSLGLSGLSKALVALANVFAILTISTAFLGMTDAAAERLSVEGLDYRISRSAIAILAAIVAFLASGLRVTTLLGLAGALGGGLSMLVMPRVLGEPRRPELAVSAGLLSAYFVYLRYSATSASEAAASALFLAAFLASVATIARERKRQGCPGSSSRPRDLRPSSFP